MVESPGTAPGSDPLITSAFMSIAPLRAHSEHRGHTALCKGGVGIFMQVFHSTIWSNLFKFG